mmetsp:Transcript_11393/g.15945  ORF Transcript_11393/g.15945 Transcript_11393/m.15945 type:complete len:179 (+) Transcript_11393:81-617(+)|eukprot:CAMPEP_0184487038 /NCGR_PEP_ID=MMETSP0113_2-20130426/9043_1 /TAXON_ID=91329 /ORGANISM="Norrisiella sphaerica, Strain BC52" /LENGTH=178 /DNA_ID=CAMNT_0026869183 /DNA_START=66 /DNA_END=602 /DNA_ORIENTATION=+
MSSQGARLVRELWNSNEDSTRDKAVALISKILKNVLKNPSEPKFRKIKKSAIDKRLSPVNGALNILSFVGFVTSTEHYVLPESCELSNLLDVVEVFDKRAKERAEAEANLKQIQEANAKKVKAKMDAKNQHRKQMKAEHDAAQKDVRQKIIVESKANQINFGMKLKKFVPPKDPPKGG